MSQVSIKDNFDKRFSDLVSFLSYVSNSLCTWKFSFFQITIISLSSEKEDQISSFSLKESRTFCRRGKKLPVDIFIVSWMTIRSSMAIRVVEFSNGEYKIWKVLPKNQHPQRKLWIFENWISGSLRSFQKSEF